MHTLTTIIVEKPVHADDILRRFQEQWDDGNWGYWDWWSHGGRWSSALEEEGCKPDEGGYYVLPLERAKEQRTPIVVTPFGHVFDSGQLTYEVSRSEAWDTVRDSIFDEFIERNTRYQNDPKYVAVMVDVHS